MSVETNLKHNPFNVGDSVAAMTFGSESITVGGENPDWLYGSVERVTTEVEDYLHVVTNRPFGYLLPDGTVKVLGSLRITAGNLRHFYNRPSLDEIKR